LARLADGLRDGVVRALQLRRYTPSTITDPEALLRELAVVRTRGWAISNEEFVIGVVGCGVPVIGLRNSMAAGLAISVPAARLSIDELPKHLPALQSAAARLGATLHLSAPG